MISNYRGILGREKDSRCEVCQDGNYLEQAQSPPFCGCCGRFRDYNVKRDFEKLDELEAKFEQARNTHFSSDGETTKCGAPFEETMWNRVTCDSYQTTCPKCIRSLIPGTNLVVVHMERKGQMGSFCGKSVLDLAYERATGSVDYVNCPACREAIRRAEADKETNDIRELEQVFEMHHNEEVREAAFKYLGTGSPTFRHSQIESFIAGAAWERNH